MNIFVITGSSRGIGFGLADEFLKRGHQVVLSGSSAQSTQNAFEVLVSKYGQDNLRAHPCNVTDADQVQDLWDAAISHFGRVDVWINNAGITNPYKPVWSLKVEEIDQVVKTDLLGTIYGTRAAYLGMSEQGGGHIYNMEGFGSDGRMRDGLSVYGSAKYALRYFTRSFRAEIPKDSAVKVSLLSPGMVATDLLMGAYETREEFERSRRILNLLAEPLEVIAPWLADRILVNKKNGAEIRYLTPQKMLLKLITAPFRRRDIFTPAIQVAFGEDRR